jgi:hypothetical protein
MKRLVIVFFASLTLAADLHAQTAAATASPTPPLPPLIKRAPDKTQWVITYNLQATGANSGGAKGATGKPAPPPKRRLVIKNQDMILEETLNENGVTIETWHIQSGLAVTSVGGKNWTLAPSSQPGFDTADYSSQDFAGFDWITQQNFTGEMEVKGRRCLVFQGKVVTPEPAELEAIKSDIGRDFTWVELDKNGKPKPITPEMQARQRVFNIEDYKNPVVAYIDDETRLPIALVYKTPAGVTTRTYEFQAAPTLPALPPDVQVLLKGSIQRQWRLSVARAPI